MEVEVAIRWGTIVVPCPVVAQVQAAQADVVGPAVINGGVTISMGTAPCQAGEEAPACSVRALLWMKCLRRLKRFA